MPTIIIKPERDKDFYVAWSTIVEAPLTWAPRVGIRQWIVDEWQSNHPGAVPNGISDPDARLDRADANGTSAAGGFAYFGRWDDEELIYEQRGSLPRRHLARACELLETDREAEVWDLLEPLEDNVPVRRG